METVIGLWTRPELGHYWLLYNFDVLCHFEDGQRHRVLIFMWKYQRHLKLLPGVEDIPRAANQMHYLFLQKSFWTNEMARNKRFLAFKDCPRKSSRLRPRMAGWRRRRRRRTDETGNRKEESRFPRFLNVCLSTLADSSGLRTCPTSVAVKWVWPNAGKWINSPFLSWGGKYLLCTWAWEDTGKCCYFRKRWS